MFSCLPAGHDRCFVTSRGDLWLCTREECEISRSVHLYSDMASHYECEHVKQAKTPANCDPPVVQVSEQLPLSSFDFSLGFFPSAIYM